MCSMCHEALGRYVHAHASGRNLDILPNSGPDKLLHANNNAKYQWNPSRHKDLHKFLEIFEDTYFDIISESHSFYDTLEGFEVMFPTEKTWRSINYGRAFIINGPNGKMCPYPSGRVVTSAVAGSYGWIRSQPRKKHVKGMKMFFPELTKLNRRLGIGGCMSQMASTWTLLGCSLINHIKTYFF